MAKQMTFEKHFSIFVARYILISLCLIWVFLLYTFARQLLLLFGGGSLFFSPSMFQHPMILNLYNTICSSENRVPITVQLDLSLSTHLLIIRRVALSRILPKYSSKKRFLIFEQIKSVDTLQYG